MAIAVHTVIRYNAYHMTTTEKEWRITHLPRWLVEFFWQSGESFTRSTFRLQFNQNCSIFISTRRREAMSSNPFHHHWFICNHRRSDSGSCTNVQNKPLWPRITSNVSEKLTTHAHTYTEQMSFLIHLSAAQNVQTLQCLQCVLLH